MPRKLKRHEVRFLNGTTKIVKAYSRQHAEHLCRLNGGRVADSRECASRWWHLTWAAMGLLGYWFFMSL